MILPICLKLQPNLCAVASLCLGQPCLFCFQQVAKLVLIRLQEARLVLTAFSAGCTIARPLQQPESNMIACAGPQVIESDGSEEAAEAVENLLESYFIQIDSTYDRLVSIGKAAYSFQAKLALSAGSDCRRISAD